MRWALGNCTIHCSGSLASFRGVKYSAGSNDGRQESAGASRSNFTKMHGAYRTLRTDPGDTMVVPEQINKTSVLRGLTDWSTVFALSLLLARRP